VTITVVGIGADGWSGLGEPARAAIVAADEVIGSERQLALLPASDQPRRLLPSPLQPLLEELASQADASVCVLASGDPMLHGIGASLARQLGPDAIRHGRLTVISHPSALALACGRLGWPEAEVTLVSAVTASVTAVARALQPGRRLVVYVTGTSGAADLARMLTLRGFGASQFIALEQLGGPDERIHVATAATWGTRANDPLTAIALDCVLDPGTPLHPTVPGLPDEAYDHDGALTKRHVRAVTLAALAPTPGALLWDIGAGSGSIAIEWLRAEPTARAVAIESRPERAQRIVCNADALGAAGLQVITGLAPDVLEELEPPDAIFIGGGLSRGVLDAAWAALRTRGRLVANAVTVEGEQLLLAAAADRGGQLVKLAVSKLEPLGSFNAWRSALPIVQWSVEKR